MKFRDNGLGAFARTILLLPGPARLAFFIQNEMKEVGLSLKIIQVYKL